MRKSDRTGNMYPFAIGPAMRESNGHARQGAPIDGRAIEADNARYAAHRVNIGNMRARFGATDSSKLAEDLPRAWQSEATGKESADRHTAENHPAPRMKLGIEDVTKADDDM
jgi:hypothetical protein